MKNLTTIGALLVIALMVISVLIGVRAREKQLQSQAVVIQTVMHTYDVLAGLEEWISLLKDAESGQRGYVLTGKERYLKPYLAARANLDWLTRRLQKLTDDRAEQKQRFIDLKKKTAAKLSELAQTVELRRTKGFDVAQGVILTDVGQSDMEAIRQTLAEMKVSENEVLRANLRELQSETTQSILLWNWLGLSSISSLSIALVLLRRFIGAQQEAEHDLSAKYAVVRIASEAHNFEQAIRSISHTLRESLGWDVASTWLIDDSSNSLKCFDVSCVLSLNSSGFVNDAATRKFTKGEGLPGRVWETGKATWIKDVQVDPYFLRAVPAKQSGLHTGLVFPIVCGGAVHGVCELYSVKMLAPNRRILQLVESIGQEVGQLLERLLAQEKVKLNERKFRAILDSAYGFIGLLDPQGTLLDGNQTALTFAGVKLEDVAGQPFWDTPWWSHSAKAQEQVKLAIERAARGEITRFESTHPSADGTLFEFDVSIKPVKDEEGRVVYLIPEGRDITDKKEAEKRVSEFYSTVSHELRTPLTSIRGSLGLIEGGLAGPISEKALKLITIARTQSDRLIRLINNILDWRKIEAGMLELTRKTVEAQTLVERTVEGITGMASEHEVKLVTQLETGGPLLCDEDRIVQVLTNLISNAIKFSPAHQAIAIRLCAGANGTFRFSVTDRGPGIPPKMMHKLFGKFQQIDQSDARKTEGTGLGLAISKMLVEQHGGTIGVESAVGKGCTFWFELPAALAPITSSGTSETLPSPMHAALLIEDDDSIGVLLEEYLARDNFDVIRARSIAQARELLEQHDPFFILLDLTLPDGDGIDLLRWLGSDEKRRDIPVVVVTGRDKDGNIKCGHPALLDWISKPFDELELYRAFDAVRQRVGPARVLLIEDDPSAREVLRQQLDLLGVSCIEAKDGAEAVKAFRDSDPDLIILDLSIPAPDGFAVVDILSREPNGSKPLIVYTAFDVSSEHRELLRLGLTAHLTKSVSSIDTVIKTVREFLDAKLPGNR